MGRFVTHADGTRSFVRFSREERFEHWLVAILFVLLVLTGLPQRFPEFGASRFVTMLFGGFDWMRIFHRLFGVLFSLAAVWHVGFRVVQMLRHRIGTAMFFSRHDFQNAIANLRYYIGLTEHEARCDRFDYKQKFEYWGMIFGAGIMIASGLLLYFPAFCIQWLPGEFIAAAKIIHSNEAFLALMVVVVWHMYDAIFSPEVFPIDTAMFTGLISEERMWHEHPLEYEREIQSDPLP